MADSALVRYGPEDRLEAVVADPNAGGTYVLLFDMTAPATVAVGSLGTHEFADDRYAYVGSAFGPGGFSRVDRHRRHLAGDAETVHWHVDALTTRPDASFHGAVLIPGRDVECAVARRLPAGPVDGLGSSDCRCRSHLSVTTADAVERAVRTVLDTSTVDADAEKSGE